MTLESRMQSKISNIYLRVNSQGKNLGGRKALQLEIWYAAPAGNNPLKKTTTLAPVPGPALALVPIDTVIGDAKRWREEAVVRVGDVDLEIAPLDAAGNLLTREQLLGTDLAPGYQVRYRLGGELYTIAAGTLKDVDGLGFKLALERVPV